MLLLLLSLFERRSYGNFIFCNQMKCLLTRMTGSGLGPASTKRQLTGARALFISFLLLLVLRGIVAWISHHLR